MMEWTRKFLKVYGQRLQNKRKEAELTQSQVARLVKVSQAIISHIENGLYLPPVELEEAILKLYDERRMWYESKSAQG